MASSNSRELSGWRTTNPFASDPVESPTYNHPDHGPARRQRSRSVSPHSRSPSPARPFRTMEQVCREEGLPYPPPGPEERVLVNKHKRLPYGHRDGTPVLCVRDEGWFQDNHVSYDGDGTKTEGYPCKLCKRDRGRMEWRGRSYAKNNGSGGNGFWSCGMLNGHAESDDEEDDCVAENSQMSRWHEKPRPLPFRPDSSAAGITREAGHSNQNPTYSAESVLEFETVPMNSKRFSSEVESSRVSTIPDSGSYEAYEKEASDNGEVSDALERYVNALPTRVIRRASTKTQDFARTVSRTLSNGWMRVTGKRADSFEVLKPRSEDEKDHEMNRAEARLSDGSCSDSRRPFDSRRVSALESNTGRSALTISEENPNHKGAELRRVSAREARWRYGYLQEYAYFGGL